MAAFLIPMTALVGSAVDVARLYVVKVRLQQACDAGVLAGRKFMADSNSSTLDANATTQASTFFKNNLRDGWMQTHDQKFTPTKTSDNQVAGVAQTTVPMTVTKFLGIDETTLNVTCQARFDVADTDVMFVLDTTGSMSCLPTDNPNCANTPYKSYTRSDGSTDYYNTEKDGSKLQAVRDAVVSFYDTFAKNADPSTHVRYGFVSYSSTVNVGQAVYSLSPSYFVDNATYQSRKVSDDYVISTSVNIDTKINNKTACDARNNVRDPATALTYKPDGTATRTTTSWTLPACTVTTNTLGPRWTYQEVTYPTTNFMATVSNNKKVIDPSKVDSSMTDWLGCIEERSTTPGINSPSGFDIKNLPADLDPDLKPSGPDSQWRPRWPAVEYARNNFKSTDPQDGNGDNESDNPSYNGYGMLSGGSSVCPAAASRLSVKTRTDITNYVDSLHPHGGTYHDIGMIWGVRMLSSKGIFAGDTQAWPGRDEPKRVIVFLTDGQMAPQERSYSAYGIEYFDKRVRGTNTDDLADYHNARFQTECNVAKAHNMDVWVVAVGQSLTAPLQACASSANQAIYAPTGKDVSDAFVGIAKKIAMLRISQ